MTITDPAIKAGDTIYALTSTGIRAVGTATTNGQATVTFTNDPAFVVAAVPRLGTVAGRGRSRAPASKSAWPAPPAPGARARPASAWPWARPGPSEMCCFAKGHFALNAGRAGHLSLPVSGAGPPLLRSGAGKPEELAGNLTIALLGGKKSEHRVVVREAHRRRGVPLLSPCRCCER